jgi:hypothetical protein
VKFKFDIDDTILFSDVDACGNYTIRSANFPLIERINRLYDTGNIIILETGRHWNHMEITQSQLLAAGVKYHTLIMGKPPVDYYVEDKAVTPEQFMEMDL